MSMVRKPLILIIGLPLLAFLVVLGWGVAVTGDPFAESLVQATAMVPFLIVGVVLAGFVAVFALETFLGLVSLLGMAVLLPIMGRDVAAAWNNKMTAFERGIANWIRTVGTHSETRK